MLFHIFVYMLFVGALVMGMIGFHILKVRREDSLVNSEFTYTVHYPEDEDEDDYDEDEDDDEDDYDEDEDEDDYLSSRAPVYGPETFEIAYMTLKLSKPHLFADDWFKTSEREFSAWAVAEWLKIAQHRKECGLAA